jgi:seryl-tRNA synthetase
MLDPKLLRDQTELVKQATIHKRVGSPDLVDQWLQLDASRRAAQTKADSLRAEQGKIGGEVGKLKGKLKGAASPELDALLAKATDIKTQYESAISEQTAFEKQAADVMLQLPAIPDPSWPIGKDDNENLEYEKWHDPSRPPRTGGKSHVDLLSGLGIVDFARGVKLAGSRSYVMRGAGAMLYNAVLKLAMDVIQSRGYEPYVVPVLVSEACMIGTGYFPAGREQAYVTQDGSALVGTSEVPLASFFAEEILDESQLPIRMCAVSTCFRREAGAAGKDTAGLYRVHQFDKVEQVVIHKADDEEHIKLHEEIIENSRLILQKLKLPYRVLKVCTGDMGQGKWRMYDIESWMPSRNAYGETHSGSALRDFQARRLNLRYRKTGEKSPTFAYTLNNTAIACPRVLIAIVEQYALDDGSIEVPEALRPYMNGLERIAAVGS